MTPKNYPSRITDEYRSSRMVVDMMRKLYKQNKKKLLNSFWEIELAKQKRSILPLFCPQFAPWGKNWTKKKKKNGDIPPRNNHTKFESNPPGSCWDNLLTDGPTDGRSATTIGPSAERPMDLINSFILAWETHKLFGIFIVFLYTHLLHNIITSTINQPYCVLHS